MKKAISFALALAMVLSFAGCSQEPQGHADSDRTASQASEPTTQTAFSEEPRMTPQQANDALDEIYIAAGPSKVPNPSCGIVLPADLPMEYVEIKATGVLKENDQTVDLLEGKEIVPDEWIVFEDLNQYSKAECTISIVWEGTIFGTGTIDLLDYENVFQRPEGVIFPQNQAE